LVDDILALDAGGLCSSLTLSAQQKLEQWAKLTGHLSPQLLKSELLDFRRMKGYVPPTIVIHLNPLLEGEIAPEIAEVALELGASISLGQEGMKVTL